MGLVSLILDRLTLAEYHEQEEIFKLRLGHLKKVGLTLNLQPRFPKTFFFSPRFDWWKNLLIKPISHCTQSQIFTG